jgi:hypothetical protein
MNRHRKQHIKAFSKSVRGIARAEHFASGGDLASWRGRHVIVTDSRKETSRTACRSISCDNND